MGTGRTARPSRARRHRQRPRALAAIETRARLRATPRSQAGRDDPCHSPQAVRTADRSQRTRQEAARHHRLPLPRVVRRPRGHRPKRRTAGSTRPPEPTRETPRAPTTARPPRPLRGPRRRAYTLRPRVPSGPRHRPRLARLRSPSRPRQHLPAAAVARRERHGR